MSRLVAALVLAGAALLAGCAGGADPVHFATLDEAKADAARRSVPILLDFSTSW